MCVVSACSSEPDEAAWSAPAQSTAPVRDDTARSTSSAGAGVAGNKASSGAAGSQAGARAGTPPTQPADAGAAGPAGAAGKASAAGADAAGAGAAGAGAASVPSEQPNDSDAGAMPESSTEVTIIAEASFAPVTLMVTGAACAAGRCTVAPPSDGKLKVALTLEHKAAEPMPVLARWQGCGTPTTQFFPVTPSGTEYILNYETEFSDLQAGSTCTAEIVEGGWLVFAGNMSTQILEGESYCTLLQVSQMGVNASCFPPPGTRIAIESDLPRWDCVTIELDGTTKDSTQTQMQVSLTSAANQLVSCTGAAQ